MEQNEQPRKKFEPRTPEAAARKKAHQFGQPDGNRPCPPQEANSQRRFYAWVESKATAEELEAYMNDETKPAARRRFIQAYMNAQTVWDFVQITNQTHGMPKQTIETPALPKIEITIDPDA